jgi:two-component system CheB/CheR fusion protein
MDPLRPLNGIRILLVEDSADAREAFVRLLELDGATVVSAADAREGAVHAAAQDFDVIVTDLGLPDISGDALIRTILATARRRPRIVAVTGYGEPYVSRARAAGADAVLIKPISWSRFLGQLVSRDHPETVAA